MTDTRVHAFIQGWPEDPLCIFWHMDRLEVADKRCGLPFEDEVHDVIALIRHHFVQDVADPSTCLCGVPDYPHHPIHNPS